jgi:hypothetical protein
LKMKVPQMEGGRFSLRTKATESAAAAIQIWNPSCYDVLDSGAQYVSERGVPFSALPARPTQHARAEMMLFSVYAPCSVSCR